MHASSLRQLISTFIASVVVSAAAAQDAKSLAAQINSSIHDGASFVKCNMDIRSGGTKTSLKLWIKSRRTAAGSDILYQVIFPKERKGEAFLLRKAGGRPATGIVFAPASGASDLSAAQMKNGIFGSDISYEDVIENFFAWNDQTITGTETLDRVPCQVLESKPGGARSSYGKVKSWIDSTRLLPVRVEKFLPSGQLAVRIDTQDRHKDDINRWVASQLGVSRPGSSTTTVIEGTEIKHGITFSDADFTAEAMAVLSIPKSSR